jgi:putative hydrolase of the HAD superfamily
MNIGEIWTNIGVGRMSKSARKTSRKTYKHYIFDLYGTLIDLHTDEEKTELWQHLATFYRYQGANYEAADLQSTYLTRVKEKLATIQHTDYPDIEISVIFRELYEARDVKVSDELVQLTMRLFRALSLEYLKLYDGVLETLQWLRANGGKLYLLSNGQREFSLPELRMLGIIDVFDGLYFSADYEMCKPDVHFMEKLLIDHQIPVAEAVMIGNDHTTDIEIANRLGMDSVYFHSNCSHAIKRVKSTHRIWDQNFRKLKRIF